MASIYVHAANVCFLLAYLVRDILKLRILTFAAGLFLLVFHLVLEPPSWGFVAWDLLFSAIQIVQIKRLIDERRPVALSEDERAVHRLAFRSLLPREVKRLCGAAKMRDLTEAEVLVKAGEEPAALTLILDGEVLVVAGGDTVATLRAGQFVGEMTFLAGGQATADAISKGATRVACFGRAELSALMEAAPELRNQIQATLGQDLVTKLRR